MCCGITADDGAVVRRGSSGRLGEIRDDMKGGQAMTARRRRSVSGLRYASFVERVGGGCWNSINTARL